MEKQSSTKKIHAAYWRRNVLIMIILLAAWAVVGLGGGILFADTLNEIDVPRTGLPLGFWMAQQGSIIGFVVIIFAYCVSLNILDRGHRRRLKESNGGSEG